MALGEDAAIHTTLKQMLLAVLDQADDSAEVGGALLQGHIGHQTQHLVDVALAVVSHAAIACAHHTRLAAQGINLKTRVVAEAVVAIMLLDILGLETRVALDGGGCLGNLLVTVDVGQAQHLVVAAHDLAQFLQLMGIVGSEYYLFQVSHHCFENY